MTTDRTLTAETRGWPSRGPVRWRLGSAAVSASAFVVALLALTPVAGLIFVAFGPSEDIWPHLVRHVIPVALIETALLLAGVAAVTIVTGLTTAWIVTTFSFPGRDALAWLLPLPLAIPTYIVAYIYVDMLGAFGGLQTGLRWLFGWRSAADYWFPEVRSLPGAILLMGLVLYPYVYLAARAMLQAQGVQVVEAARMLGARPWRVALQITLPMARPAIAVGGALALLETLNDIGASEYLGVHTLTLSIFTTWLNRGSLAGAAQMACLMLLIVAGFIALERYGRRGRDFSVSAQDTRQPVRIRLEGGTRWLAAAICLLPVTLGFLLPAGYLLRETIVRGLLIGFDPSLVEHALTTVALAAAATTATLALGFLAATALRYAKGPLTAACVSIGGIGYAVPGTVLALGLLHPLVIADEGINGVIRLLGFPGVGLVLAGSVAAIVVAYVVRFLAISIGFAQAGLSRISPDLEDVARILGAGAGRMARTIHLPLARPAVWSAALLIFVDCLKELPATLLLRPLNVETLATYIYQFATRGSFEQGSLAAVIIVAAGILPVVHITRYADAAAGLGTGRI
ncbi:MAG: iron ABC transporter permease [Hyphomicrobiales bacterium]|nr:iron ABC transporter permease [Hyphomicrobiales bacterium]